MAEYKFYFMVKPIVERIIIYQLLPNGLKYIDEMKSAEDSETNRIFNGTLPMSLEKQRLIIRLLGESGEATYKFNNLFSKPITKEILQKMKEKGKNILNNIIIINTPKEVEFVIVEVPHHIQEIFKLPKNILTVDVEKNKIALFPEKTTVAEKLSKGVDPQGRNYIKFINLDLSEIINNNLSNELIELLDKNEFIIKCYNWNIIKDFSFERK